MAYKHGVIVSEVPTSILPAVQSEAGIPFIVGTAPVGMTDPANVNKPVLCHSYAEAVEAFGFVPAKLDSASGLKKFEYSISEFLSSQFSLFGIEPVIIVNVLDPSKHKITATTTTVTLDSKTGAATIAETGIVKSTVKLSSSGSSAYALGTDYSAEYDDDGYLVITSLKGPEGNFKCTTGTALTFAADKTDPSKVDADDVVGGVDLSGNKSGLELIGDCFPRFRLVPGIVLAPGFSGNATVAAVMAAKCASINNLFKSVCLVDVPTDTVKDYSGVPSWKSLNNITDPLQTACWPMLAIDGVLYHMSTQLAGLMGLVDSDNGDVPYASPSNKNLQMTSTVLADGTEVWLDQGTNANYLNGQGVVTAINWTNGWVCWGNRTAAYPGSTDVKDTFIPVRRMFNWIGNTLIQTFWQRLDYPLNRRQIDTIVDSANVWLNGLTARQYILGGRVEFLESENSTADLMDGIARFHVYITPPSPNRSIEFILEYDPTYIETLFG